MIMTMVKKQNCNEFDSFVARNEIDINKVIVSNESCIYVLNENIDDMYCDLPSYASLV